VEALASGNAVSPHGLSDVVPALTAAVISVISPNFAAGISKELSRIISTTITNTFTDISPALGLTIASAIAIPSSSNDAGIFQDDDDQWVPFVNCVFDSRKEMESRIASWAEREGFRTCKETLKQRAYGVYRKLLQ